MLFNTKLNQTKDTTQNIQHMIKTKMFMKWILKKYLEIEFHHKKRDNIFYDYIITQKIPLFNYVPFNTIFHHNSYW